MQLSNKPDIKPVCSTVRLILFLTISIYVFISGCKQETIWSTESRSPDGKITATARAVGGNGFGTGGGIHTFAYLNWTADSQAPTMILDLIDNTNKTPDTKVEMKWLTPTHLEITYTGNRVLGFQAAKWAGVDISVRDLNNTVSSPSQY